MITIRTMKQIATSQTIPNFRACRSLGRSHLICEQGRIKTAQSQMLDQEALRQWRNQQWQKKSQQAPTRQR
jgi:alkylated DNA nucleotide flippase Atl1